MKTTAYAAVGLTLCETARSHTASNKSADFKQLCGYASEYDDVMAQVIE